MSTDAVFRTFEHDAGNERAIGLLRLSGAIAVLIGSVWLVLAYPLGRAWLAAAIGVLASLGWIAMFARSKRRARSTITLRLGPESLVLDEGATRTELAWSEVHTIAVDEDRLFVRIERASGEPLIIEPMWRDVSVYALASAIRDAWQASPGRSGRPEPPAA